jgi:hypothetical protein
MQEKMKQLEEATALAAITYERACIAFDNATVAYRASVMAYDIAVGSDDSAMFKPPPLEDKD